MKTVVRLALLVTLSLAAPVCLPAQEPAAPAQKQDAAADTQYEYRLLATNRTTTMEKEMKEAAEAGYRFEKAISGPTMCLAWAYCPPAAATVEVTSESIMATQV